MGAVPRQSAPGDGSPPSGDFVAWAVRCLFRDGENADQVGPAPALPGQVVPPDDERVMARLRLDALWEIALQRELVTGDDSLSRTLLLRGALPSRRRAPIVEFVRSDAGRRYVRDHFRACLTAWITALEATSPSAASDGAPVAAGTRDERLAKLLSEKLGARAAGVRRLLDLPDDFGGAGDPALTGETLAALRNSIPPPFR